MKAKELRDLTVKELNDKLLDYKKEMEENRFDGLWKR